VLLDGLVFLIHYSFTFILMLLIRIFTLGLGLLLACSSRPDTTQVSGSPDLAQLQPGKNPWYSRTDTAVLKVTDAQWKKVLTPEVYEVARKKGTEWAFSGKLYKESGLGNYYCAVCGNGLFKSDAKFASSCGWPSFFEARRPGAVRYLPDNSHGMERIEVQCGRCSSHLGHLFDDGPPPTGKRFCMNSIVLDFEPLK
jgi:peptide-methionine (R)-S-oxide reductase